MKRECETCIKRKTTYCPTSIECMATDDMPYYQNRIMLLEENKRLNSAIQTYDILLKFNVESNNQLKLINQEHQQINGELRQANKLLNEQYIRLYKDYEQQEQIKYLERSNNRREDTILEQRQEISDLKDNWDKLKEYIRKNIIYDDVGMKILDPSPLEDYMQELEGSDSNE